MDLSFSCSFAFRFELKQKNSKENGEAEILEVTVYDYFVNYRKIDLRYSADLPCINVGKPKRPTYIPLEVMDLLLLCCCTDYRTMNNYCCQCFSEPVAIL